MDQNRAVSSPAGRIRLLVVDEHPVVGEGIRATVGAEPDIHVETVTDLGSAPAALATRQLAIPRGGQPTRRHAWGAEASRPLRLLSGSRTTNFDPTPSTLVTWMSPPCSSIRSLAPASPSPVPANFAETLRAR
jgi:hypothetical protein